MLQPSSSLPSVTVHPLPYRLRMVLDTNVILEDIWYCSRPGRQSRLQKILQDPKHMAIMAESIADEVVEKLCELQRGDVEAQIQLWHTAYKPYIYIVRLRPDAYQENPQIQQLWVRDPDDVPTAQLALLLHPEYLFSLDGDLDAFARTGEVGQVIASYQDLQLFYAQMNAVAMVPIGGFLLTTKTFQLFRRMPFYLQLLVGGATLGMLIAMYPTIRKKVASFFQDPNTLAFFEQVGMKVVEKYTMMSQASLYIQDRLPEHPPTHTVFEHLRGILAVVDEALTLDDIYWYILARGYQPKGETSKQYILTLLRKHACFQMSEDGYWELVRTD